MRQLLLLLVMLPAFAGYAQTKVVDVGKSDVRITDNMFYAVGGTPVSTTKYVRIISGSPYFNDTWMKGRVMVENEHIYDSLQLKLDMIDQTLSYLNTDGSELIATTAVKAVTLFDAVTGRQYNFAHSSFLQLPKGAGKGWCQLLVGGSVKLYKLIVKTIAENKPYGSATVEQTINTTEQYFVVVNNVFTRVKKMKELPELLTDKKTELNTFISSNNLSGRSDADYSSLLTYYNSITATK
jgi:hypothetical protein